MNQIEINYNVFKKKYFHLYPYHIRKQWPKFMGQDLYSGNSHTFMEQVYAEIGYFKDEVNPYLQYIELIKKYHGLSGNILEIGCGFFPVLSKKICENKSDNGLITAYDPNLIITKMEGLDLRKSIFSETVNINKYDKILGIRPCLGTTTMLSSALDFRKDFFLVFCACLPPDEEMTTSEWQNLLINVVCSNLKSGDIFRELSNEMPYYHSEPIISVKFKH